ncbi:efflux transporter outer membrane subunit [Oxalobacter paraformigenes]|uniref:NodT family efflux transporter, outer membrane factor (OMF) lipoprotein n=1 Tax=Oxalobacter paraformigenes TaxID=556268 RepID=C3X439_9BURK|nr:efflux transporter outer membrane subunit [Oxalobacter paraformigenes]EEO27975.1 NodT family efflux transporter, outer membrane factor (OMF) lipoprotein [Oxalobacter paraformigenes]
MTTAFPHDNDRPKTPPPRPLAPGGIPAASLTAGPAPAPAIAPAATALHAAPETAAPSALFSALRLAAALAFGTALLAGCAIGPDYVRPDTAMPAAYKEDSLWKTAKPADDYPRGQWWRVFHDAELDRLMERLNRQNLTIAQAEAQYRQAQALLRQAESALFPSLTLDAGRTRGALSSNSSALSTRNQAIGTLSWEVDLWGGIRRNVEAGEAGAAASIAQLDAIRLSQQAQLATAYLELIVTDRQIARLEESEKLLAESLKLTQNQYNAGLVSDASVAQAESQLKIAQAATLDAKLARVRLEHAIAVSIGEAPAALTLSDATEDPYLPHIPAGIPSTLLQRRPDIAAAERRVAEANALIGVAQSAFFPSLTLSATGGWSGPSFGDLFTVPNRIWSIGPAIALSVFDAGLRRAQTDEAIAVYDETVAAYRQQVLTAFQEVEDNLAAQAMLDDESALQSAAVAAARRSETITLNQYRAGIVGYLELLVAQTSRIAAENTLWDIRKRQFASSVALIAAIGGQWGEEEQQGEKKTQDAQPEHGKKGQAPETRPAGTPEAASGKTIPEN